MTATVEVSQVIDRPVSVVFRFLATDHVRNHPRWDPNMELEQITAGPIGVGTMIRRRNSHGETPVEGTMEVVEFEPKKAMAMVIHDGPVEMRSRVQFEALNEDQTRLTSTIEFPGMDDSMDKTFLLGELEKAGRRRKELIESET